MMRDLDTLDFRAAFPAMPEECRHALLTAARSVKEEKEMKKASIRVALIAAAIVLSMMAVAFAAGTLTNQLGWTDYFSDHKNVNIPQSAVEQMQVTEDIHYQVGPMTFTVTELLNDGHIAVSSMNIRTADGSAALLCYDPWDTLGANGENGRAIAQQMGLDPKTTYIEAAKALNLPLYTVRGILDLSEEYTRGESMEDCLWNADGSMTYLSMASLNTGVSFEEVQAGLYLRVARIDPTTGEEAEKWIDRDQTVTLTACPVLETRTYIPSQETIVAGQRLLKVEAERYVTGAYLTLTWEQDLTAIPESVWELYDLELLDANGQPLPEGMSLSSSLTFTITQQEMLGVEALPDTITLADGTVLTAK